MIRDISTNDDAAVPPEVSGVAQHGVTVADLVARADTAPLTRVSRRSTRCDTMPLPVLAEPPAPVEAPLVIAPPPAVRREHTALKLSFAGFGLTLAVALVGVALSGKTPTTPGVPQAAAPVVTSSSVPPTTPSAPAPTTTPSPVHVATPEHPRTPHTQPPKTHHAPHTKAKPSDPRAKLQELLRTIQNYQRHPQHIPGWPPTR